MNPTKDNGRTSKHTCVSPRGSAKIAIVSCVYYFLDFTVPGPARVCFEMQSLPWPWWRRSTDTLRSVFLYLKRVVKVAFIYYIGALQKMNRPNRNMAQLCVQHTNIKRIVNMDWDPHYDAVIESSVWLHNDPPQREQEIA